MTQLLERALSELQKLPESEQDVIASRILEEIEDDRRWDAAFDASQEQLAAMAKSVRAEIAAGKVSSRGFDEL